MSEYRQREAVLYVGHGSKDPEGNEEFRRFALRMAQGAQAPIQEACFLEFAEPDISDGIERCVRQGADTVRVIPVMLFPAGHSKVHVPSAIVAAREDYPHVRFVYGRPVGVEEHVQQILTDRLRETGWTAAERSESDTALLLVGRGSSDSEANSDLFKVARLFWERTPVRFVETAFMGVTAPLLPEGLERCRLLGARHIIVLPYFLFTGILIRRMERMTAEFAARHPQLEVRMGRYFGDHPLLLHIIRERMVELEQGEGEDVMALLAGAHVHAHSHAHPEHGP